MILRWSITRNMLPSVRRQCQSSVLALDPLTVTKELSSLAPGETVVVTQAAASVAEVKEEKKTFPFPEDIVKREEAEPPIDEVPSSFLPRMVHQGGQIKEKTLPVDLAEAIRSLKASRKSRFDETVEAHVRLGVDPKRSDQTVRGSASLPHGTGRTVRVAVFAEGAAAEEAVAAGADVVGSDDLVMMVKESGGKLDFDKCIATPAMMPKLGQVARILGPRGLMPNPKLGSVTTKVGDAIRKAKQGQVDYRADKTGIIHAGVGKLSFQPAALEENIGVFAAALLASKPVGMKKTNKFAGYFNSFTISSTQGPGITVSIQSVADKAEPYIKAE